MLPAVAKSNLTAMTLSASLFRGPLLQLRQSNKVDCVANDAAALTVKIKYHSSSEFYSSDLDFQMDMLELH